MEQKQKSKSIWDYIDEQEDEDFSLEDQPTYLIQNKEQAERVVHSYKRVIKEIMTAKSEADRWLEMQNLKYKSYLESNVQPLQDKAEFLVGILRKYAEEQVAVSNKKSVKLVEGTLQFTKTQDKYDHDDNVILDYIAGVDEDNTLRKFLKEQPCKLDWSGLKADGTVKTVTLKDGTEEKHLFYNGVEIPGVVIQTDLPPSFKVK